MSIEDCIKSIAYSLDQIAKKLVCVPRSGVTEVSDVTTGPETTVFPMKPKAKPKAKSKSPAKPKLKAKAEKDPLAALDDLGLGDDLSIPAPRHTSADVRGALTALVQAKDEELGKDQGLVFAKGILESCGQTMLSQIPEESFGVVIDALESALNG